MRRDFEWFCFGKLISEEETLWDDTIQVAGVKAVLYHTAQLERAQSASSSIQSILFFLMNSNLFKEEDNYNIKKWTPLTNQRSK